VLLDGSGYAKLCDFGFAKKVAKGGEGIGRAWTKCGTDEYAPPEVLSGRGRSSAADWWALGILLHEIFAGRPPFEGNTAEDVFRVISEYCAGGSAAEQRLRQNVVHLRGSPISQVGLDFLMALLRPRESDRLGSGGFLSVRTHPWFDGVSWEGMLRREVDPPQLEGWRPEGGIEDGFALNDEPVMRDQAYDRPKWDPIFAPFGPHRREPWPEL
jgi:serine/threonine protein kinase